MQILAGPPDLRSGIFGSLLKLIALTTLVVFPVLLLLLLQIQFLPYHDLAITNAQRLAVILDIVVLWVLRPPIRSPESAARSRFLTQAPRGFGLVVGAAMSVAAVWLSIVVATIPFEWQETALAALNPPVRRDGKNETKQITVRDLLFAGDVDRTTRRRDSLFSNTLVLPGFNIYEALKIDDPEKLAWKEHLIDLRGRHLEEAILDFANLTKADLTGAWLHGASLFNARLQKATLQEAQLQDASLKFARLQGASLELANLQGATLESAQLQGASLYFAKLQGASLAMTNLQGASLSHSKLQGAYLFVTQLQGARLESAELQGAVFVGASLEGASFEGAQLQWASLIAAKIEATDFSNSSLWHALWMIEAAPALIKLEGATWRPVENMQNLSASVPRNNKLITLWRDQIRDIPDAKERETNLRWINMLDCVNRGKTLESCYSAAATPPEAQEWQRMLERASVGNAAYEQALARWLWWLVCQNGTDTIHILRGVMSIDAVGLGHLLPGGGDTSSTRLAATGHKAPELVDFIMSKECPVSASLTNDDKARLLEIKREAAEKFPPPSASKKEK